VLQCAWDNALYHTYLTYAEPTRLEDYQTQPLSPDTCKIT